MRKIYIRVKTEEQLKAVLEWDQADVLIADHSIIGSQLLAEKMPSIYISLPDIAREAKIESIEKIYDKCKSAEGLMIKSLDELGLLVDKGYSGKVLGDAFLYAYNSEAVGFYKDMIPDIAFVCSDELTDRELKDTVDGSRRLGLAPDKVEAAAEGVVAGRVNVSSFIYKIYGYQQLMITNQCISHNYTGCSEKLMKFKDERGNDFYAESNCGQCYSVIYNGKCTYMLDKLDEISNEGLLVDFTIESGKETREILTAVDEALKETGKRNKPEGITRGHHYRGVD